MKDNTWKEFFMALAVAIVFVLQAFQGAFVVKNSTFIEDMNDNREAITERLTTKVNELIDKRCSDHLVDYHMEQIDDEAL